MVGLLNCSVELMDGSNAGRISSIGEIDLIISSGFCNSFILY
jgi:hypothetical protein